MSSPTFEAGTITAFIARARRAARGRLAMVSVLDAATVTLIATLAAAVVAAVSLRGDLVAPALLVALLGALSIGLTRRIRAARRAWGTDLSAARSIAAHDAPLTDDSRRRDRSEDKLLRHELLGALELAHQPERHRSPGLVAAYLHDVSARLQRPGVDPRLALPRPALTARAWVTAALALALAVAANSPQVIGGLTLILHQTDARPPAPPEPVWTNLVVELHDPPHTRRAPRTVPNPSGALRMVAGTEVHLSLTARRPAAAGKVVVAYDPAELATPPEPVIVELEAQDDERLHWTGRFVAQATGTWSVVLLDDAESLETSIRRSPAMTLEIEPDRPAEVELSPLPRSQREVSEHQSVDVRFSARDDFGIASAQLAYQLPDGTTHRLPVEAPSGEPRSWRHRHTWDISAIPIEARSEVLFWVEVRDNDPGLGLEPLPDPPGKRSRSATMRLTVRDDESEHAANLVELVDLRDTAVDLLAQRMTTRAFEPAEVVPPIESGLAPLAVRIERARDILAASGRLLAMLATAIDSLSMDSLTEPRDAAALTGIHRRLWELHQAEQQAHEALPPGQERIDPEAAAKTLPTFAPHNRKALTQLEDEIIRLDDLVDALVLKRIEALVARLEATQRKLLAELQKLKAGDESARARIEQLQLRRRDDLRRLSEARAMLQREVDPEFMNTDAFGLLEEIAKQEDLGEMVKQGKLDQALEKMQQQLQEIQQMRDGVQQQLGKAQPGQTALSEEDRQRMQLLRELSRLQDEVGVVREQTRTLDDAWRDAVADQAATEANRKRAAEQARELAESLESVNDARLGRDARRGLEDAIAALHELEQAGERDETKQLELLDQARTALDGVSQGVQGSEAREAEGKALRAARKALGEMTESLERRLPAPTEALSEDEVARLGELGERQRGLKERSEAVRKGELSHLLPGPGRKAMRQAGKAMERSAGQLEDGQPRDATGEQGTAYDAIQRAIDSLRQGSPPPPSGGATAEASTEAERDRTLRDELLDAMREGTPEGYDAPIKRYYEELLR